MTGAIPTRAGEYLLLATLSALRITEAEQPISTALLTDRIVVIGGSFAESQDIHLTPLGAMPGALIIINAFQSLTEHGELEAIPLWLVLLIETVLIVVMSIAFIVYRNFWGQIISGLFILLVLLPISYALFRHGVWISFALPLLAVQIRQIWAEFVR